MRPEGEGGETGAIDCDEKDSGCILYQNALRSEIVSKSKLTSVEGKT